MNPRPTDVIPLDEYKLLVTFKNNERKVYDVLPLLPLPIYKTLENKGLFSSVKTDGMCVFWNEDIDICPDRLYEDSVPLLDEP
jgi:hypothetical protein